MKKYFLFFFLGEQCNADSQLIGQFCFLLYDWKDIQRELCWNVEKKLCIFMLIPAKKARFNTKSWSGSDTINQVWWYRNVSSWRKWGKIESEWRKVESWSPKSWLLKNQNLTFDAPKVDFWRTKSWLMKNQKLTHEEPKMTNKEPKVTHKEPKVVHEEQKVDSWRNTCWLIAA